MWESRLRSTRLLWKAVPVCMVLACVAAGCGSSSSSSSSTASASPAANTGTGATSGSGGSSYTAGAVVATKNYVAPPSSTPWLVWSKSQCAFVPTSNHPATYNAVLHKVSKPLNVDLASANTAQSVYQTIQAGYSKYAALAGIHLQILDNDFPSDSTPLNVAHEITVEKPAVAIEDQEVASLYPEVQNIFQQGCTPMVDQFDIGTPKPAPGFQAGYVTSGAALGKAMVQLVQQKGWPIASTWVVLCAAPLIANKPGTDLTVNTTFVQYMSEDLHIPSGQISPELNCNADPDTARNVTVDWLTAHPQAKHVIAMSWSDTIAVAMVQALQQKGYTTANALAAGGQANEAPLQLMAKGSILQDDFNKDFPHWGILGLSMAEDIASGVPVPEVNDPGVVPVVGAQAARTLLTQEGLPQ